ncbi:hypothetical protein DVH24_039461 [Malus domestica]|uniref:Uncharacterized protein n=1 Tax=Malus domestica TaxID=3750 RepID=A0A498I0J2_MALDO|nr:hypothetical protein DVH24_039461 [Malus domestica]
MLSSDDEENDVFFDSEDLSPARSHVVKEEYEIWMNEPPSVKERRKIFLRKMDLAEFASVEIGASPSSCISSSSHHLEEDLGVYTREGDNQANFMSWLASNSYIQGSSNLVLTHNAVHIVSPSATDPSRRDR